MTKAFDLRKASSEEAEEINRLYHLVTGRERSLAEYAWEWEQPPEGPGDRWVIREGASGRAVGHFGLIPLAFAFRGWRLLAGKTENTMVDPSYRSRFYYLSYEMRAFRKAQQRFDLFFTTAGRGPPGLMRRRLGYREIGYWRTYVLYASPNYVAERMARQGALWGRAFTRALLPFLSRILVLLRSRRLRRGKRIPPRRLGFTEETLNEIDCFWRRNRSLFGCTPERSSEFVRWRFSENPHHAYALYGFYDGDRLLGYLIAREGTTALGERVFRRMVVEDLVAMENRQDLCEAFIRGMEDAFRRNDLATMRVLSPYGKRDLLNRVLSAFHFFPRVGVKKEADTGAPFHAFFTDGSCPEDWYITEAVTEGVRES